MLWTLTLIALSGLIGCTDVDEQACVGLAEADCAGACRPIVGRSCVDDEPTYIGCVVQVDPPPVPNDLTWTCAAADDPEECVFLPYYHEGDPPGWAGGCPLDSAPCDDVPDCPA